MSSTPPETERHEVALTRAQRWLLHHVLATRIEDAIDADERPPAWVLETFDTVESGSEVERFTDGQARNLARLLRTYLDANPPERDVVTGTSLLNRLDAVSASTR